MPALPLSLYVHLPWCERKCPYCDFNSHERSDIPEEAYVDTLLADLRNEVADEKRAIETVFIGGGTPSLFSVGAIARLLDGIRTTVSIADDAEVTMEANPGSVESRRLAGYAAAGITRFSLGIQSFHDESLKALGRVHDSRQAAAAVDAARQSVARSFNLDLMHGLPGQTTEQGLRDLERAVSFEAPHLSWYQLTIEPNTRFYSAPPLLPADDQLAELELRGFAQLRAAGYHRYEISAWSQPGEECRHNLNYWRFGDYLAIGAGAHGKVTDANGAIRRYSKTRKPEDYLATGGIQRRNVRTLDEADRRGEFMLNALRLLDGFSLGLFEARTGLSADKIRADVESLVDEGLLEQQGEQVRTTALGQRFLDDVVGRFFTGA